MDDYVCQCDVCTGNIDNCAKCGKAQGASDLRNGLCRDCYSNLGNLPDADIHSKNDYDYSH